MLARTAAGLSQTELAEELSVTQKTISIWEKKGNIPSWMIGQLSEVTQQDPSLFMV